MVDSEVSVIVPVYINNEEQKLMTYKCLELAKKTSVPYELIISETCTDYFKDFADIYLFEKHRTKPSRSVDRGFRLSNAKYVVFLANDVFVCENWLEYMLECFKHKDCGIASLGNNEHKDQCRDEIVEGLYFSVSMMKKEDAWFDQNYKRVFDDTDLIFRLYTQGKKFYKNLKGNVHHKTHSTLGDFGGDREEYERSRAYFINKYSDYKEDPVFKRFAGIQ